MKLTMQKQSHGQKNCTLSPPPGFENFEHMVPAKVELPPKKPLSLDAAPFTPSTDGEAAQFSSGEWATKVHSVAPFLNTQGLHRALGILDQAIYNVQRTKALEEAVANAQQLSCNMAMGRTAAPNFQYAYNCTMMLVQVNTEQQELLNELQQLPYDPASVRSDFRCNSAAVRSSPNAESGHSLSGDSGTQSPLLCSLPDGIVKVGDRPKLTSTVARKVQTLSTSLQLLSGEDPDCLFIVRRINKLGFKAVRTLKRYFSNYGLVTKVLLAHSTVRQHGDPTCHARRRPSSLGFVQMGNPEAVSKVLALGTEQDVEGVAIRVQRFERQRANETIEDEEIDEEDVNFGRGLSEVSTTTASSSSVSSKAAFVDSDQDPFYMENC